MRSKVFILGVALCGCMSPAVPEDQPFEAAGNSNETLVAAKLEWSNRLPFYPRAPGILPIGGTEIRSLVAARGSLYAANGYWRDTQQHAAKTPGPQILRLDSPFGKWHVELQLDERITTGPKAGLHRYQAIGAMELATLTHDGNGKPLSSPVDVLLASTWDLTGGLRLFSRNLDGSSWSHADLVAQSEAPAGSQIRGFGEHRDAMTGADLVFAGTNPFGIFRGAYDPATDALVWSDTAEPLEAGHDPGPVGHRVLGFAECNQKLYAAIGWALYERTDGPSPSWREVFILPDPPTDRDPKAYGLRGITCVRAPNGGDSFLLSAVENRPFSIVRIEPANGFHAEQELNVSAFLSKKWQTRVEYGIAAYNDMTAYVDPAHPSCEQHLIGFEALTPDAPYAVGDNRKHPYAHYLARDCHGNYALRTIRDAKNPWADLVATRTMIVSPFQNDPPGTLYAGGFDAGNMTAHNTAWLYRGRIK